MKEITIVAPNEVGALAEIATVLGNNGINIDSISAQGFGEVGIIRLITSDVNSAMKVLERFAASKEGYDVSSSDVISISLHDKPGELGKITRMIARAGVNLECIYQLKRYEGKTELVVKTTDIDKTIEALKSEGIEFKVGH